ncbi:MAG: hypothetical protein FWF60_04385 [Oscillospiraceae bacterium]|nr:hypothetical protein [Oscillospiraceae bacterium]
MMLESCPANLDARYDDFETLAGLAKRIREVYLKCQNSHIVQIETIVQPLLEMRYAWEHFSDALLGAGDLSAAELAQARGHLLRCYKDLTEWRSLQLKTYARKIKKGLSRENIESAIPGYYAKVFPLHKKVEKMINEISDMPEEKFSQRIELLDQANGHCETILDAMNEDALYEIRKKSVSHLLFVILLPVATAAIGAFIGWLLR